MTNPDRRVDYELRRGHELRLSLSVVCPIGTPDQVAVLETVRTGKRWDRAYLSRLLRHVGGYSVRGKSRAANLAGILSLTLRNPILLAETLVYGVYRGWGYRRELAAVLRAAVANRSLSLRPLAVVVQNFMSPEELESEVGKQRLAACTFKVPHDGEMIPMCQMNATELRSQLYPRARIRKVG